MRFHIGPIYMRPFCSPEGFWVDKFVGVCQMINSEPHAGSILVASL